MRSAAGIPVWRIGEVVESGARGARALPMSARTRVAVLASGAGSNLGALLDAAQAPGFPAEVVLVVSNRRECGALTLARERGVTGDLVARQGVRRRRHARATAPSSRRCAARTSSSSSAPATTAC